jgi:hypothetical protein
MTRHIYEYTSGHIYICSKIGGHTVVWWFKHYATSRKVAGLKQYEVSDFLFQIA